MVFLATADGSPAWASEATATANPAAGTVEDAPYVPTPENLAAREWFQEARFGIFIHWGVYSVLGRGEWAMNIEKIPADEYEKLADEFNPAKFDAAEWVSLFKRSGAKYITITSKHHDGFAMWDSQAGDWDIVDRTPYGRDILKQLADECDKQGMKLFFYHSQLDWHHPDYYPRGMTGRTAERPDSGDFQAYLEFMDAQLAELLSGKYGPVGGIWFDGWWDQQTKRFKGKESADSLETVVDWHIRRTYDKIHNLQPACLIGSNHHVAPFAGEDFQMFERDLPGENKGGHSPDAKIGELPLETCDTINGAWGFNASDRDFKSVPELVHYLVRAAGRDANFLLNVGPRPDGTIDPESTARLEGIGKWMDQYAFTIRPTRGGSVEPQYWGVSTQTSKTVYLHILNLSGADAQGWLTLIGTENLEAVDVQRAVGNEPVEWRRDGDGPLQVKVDKSTDEIDVVLAVPKTAS
jgi:alpha-L-fucosidase